MIALFPELWTRCRGMRSARLTHDYSPAQNCRLTASPANSLLRALNFLAEPEASATGPCRWNRIVRWKVATPRGAA
jgi:hypothetical protein